MEEGQEERPDQTHTTQAENGDRDLASAEKQTSIEELDLSEIPLPKPPGTISIQALLGAPDATSKLEALDTDQLIANLPTWYENSFQANSFQRQREQIVELLKDRTKEMPLSEFTTILEEAEKAGPPAFYVDLCSLIKPNRHLYSTDELLTSWTVPYKSQFHGDKFTKHELTIDELVRERLRSSHVAPNSLISFLEVFGNVVPAWKGQFQDIRPKMLDDIQACIPVAAGKEPFSMLKCIGHLKNQGSLASGELTRQSARLVGRIAQGIAENVTSISANELLTARELLVRLERPVDLLHGAFQDKIRADVANFDPKTLAAFSRIEDLPQIVTDELRPMLVARAKKLLPQCEASDFKDIVRGLNGVNAEDQELWDMVQAVTVEAWSSQRDVLLTVDQAFDGQNEIIRNLLNETLSDAVIMDSKHSQLKEILEVTEYKAESQESTFQHIEDRTKQLYRAGEISGLQVAEIAQAMNDLKASSRTLNQIPRNR